MARVGGGGGPRWVWPLVILLILLGLGLLAWAFLAPQAPGTQPTQQTTTNTDTTETATPTATSITPISDITSDPSSWDGKDVTIEGEVTRRVGDQGAYIADPNGGPDLLAVLDKSLTSTDLRNDDYARFMGTAHQVTPDEIARLTDSVDKPTLDTLSNEKVYLWVNNFEKTQAP